MATIAERPLENLDAIADEEWSDEGRFDVVMTISSEARHLLARLAAAAGGTEFDVIGKAITLYAVAADARRAGLRIGLFDDDLELEREIDGF